MNRKAFERAFEPELIQAREGGFGQEIRYVESQHYIRRLNEATDGEWSFEIVEWKQTGEEALVLCRLRVGEVVKMAFGGQAITRSKSSKEPVSIADDFKAAATDALKKACSMLGVGLQLYENGNVKAKAETTPAPAEKRGLSVVSVRQSSNGFTGNFGITDRQKKALIAIAKEKGLNEAEFLNRVSEEYGKTFEELNRKEASELIQSLKTG